LGKETNGERKMAFEPTGGKKRIVVGLQRLEKVNPMDVSPEPRKKISRRERNRRKEP